VAKAGASRDDRKSDPAVLTALPNGLRVVLQPVGFAPVVSVSMWVNVGSADETPAEAGLAHLHEHMIFKGTARRGLGQIAAEVEGAGGEINAFTSYDQTCYYLTLGKDELALGLDIIADAVGGAAFDPHELKKEIEVVLEEIRLYRDLPAHHVSESCWAKVFGTHPYGRPILGSPASLSPLRRADVLRFYKQRYRPGNMVLSVAGDFDRDKTMKLIHNLFGGWRGGAVKRAPRAVEPPQTAFQSLVLRDPIRQSHLYLAWRGTNWQEPYAAELDLLSMILSHGDSSRLEHRVKSIKQLVHDVSAHVFAPRDPGIFGVDAVTNPELLPAAVGAILREVYRLRVEPVQEEELERAKRNLEAAFIGKHETAGGIGHSLGYSVSLTGDIRLEEDYLRRVMAADRATLKQAAQKFLTHAHLTAAALTPDNDTFTEADLDRIAREAYVAPVPTAKIVGKSRPGVAPALVGFAGRKGRLKMATLANGLRVAVQESAHAPLVAIRAMLAGGLRAERAEQSGIANLTAHLLSRGTQEKSAITFAKIVEGMAGSLHGFSGQNSIGVAAEFLSRDFTRAIELTAEAMLTPGFRQLEVKRKKDELVGLIREHNDEPSQVARDLFMRTLFGDHPYARPLLGTEESLQGLNAEDLEAHWRSLLHPKNLVIALAGDVDFDDAVAQVDKAFGRMKQGKFKPLALPSPKPAAEPTIVAASRKKEQTHIFAGFLGCPLASPDEHALHLLNAALSGQGGRLFLELRDKLHLAYSVYSFFREGVERGTFGVYIATNAASADRAQEAMLAQLRRVLDQPPHGAELRRAKRRLIGSQQLDLQTAGSVALTIGLNELLGLGYRTHLKLDEQIRRVTDPLAAKVARKYLTLENIVVAKVGDFGEQ
jgi:zinc protease